MPKSSTYHTNGDPTVERGRYVVSNWKDTKLIYQLLNVFGVCIIPGMFSKEESKVVFDNLIAETEEHIPNFKLSNVDTWPRIREAMATHGMILQNYGFGWFRTLVNFRSQKRLLRTFARLFTFHHYKRFNVHNKRIRKRDLFSSADAFSLYLNPDYIRKPDGTYKRNMAGYQRAGHDWLHWDQNPDDELYSVQSFVNFLDEERGKRTATFSFLESSHRFQKDFQDHFWGDETDMDKSNPRFFKIQDQAQFDFYNVKNHCGFKMLELEAGDMVLWNSKLVHQGRLGEKPMEDKRRIGHGLKRCVIYVSMQPKFYATKKDINKKRVAFKKLYTTTHNAARGVQTFNANPRTYGKAKQAELLSGALARKVTVPPPMTRFQKSLFGVL
jgi:hypothetical protein